MSSNAMSAVQALNAAFAVTEQELRRALSASSERQAALTIEVQELQNKIASITQEHFNTVGAFTEANVQLEDKKAELVALQSQLERANESAALAEKTTVLVQKELALVQEQLSVSTIASEKAVALYKDELQAARTREQSLASAFDTLKTCFATITKSHEQTVSELQGRLQQASITNVMFTQQREPELLSLLATAQGNAQAWLAAHDKLLGLFDAQEKRHADVIRTLEIARNNQNSAFELTIAQLQSELAKVHSSRTWQLHEFVKNLFSKQALPVAAQPPFNVLASEPTYTAPLAISPSTMVSYTTMSNSSATTPATTLGQLLSLHDENFVICAYRTILGRSPDEHGLKYYVDERLARGVSKIEVIKQLYSSSEAKAHGCNIPGLDKAVTSFKRGNMPVIGWVFRMFDDCERKHPVDNKLRAIEHTLYTMRRDNQVLNAKFDQMIAAVASSQGVQVIQATSPMPVGGGHRVEVKADMSMLTPQGKEIHQELKAAIHTNKGNS